MLKSKQPIILIMVLFIMSCTTPTKESTIEVEKDTVLSQVDSILSYADSELQNIVHFHEESQKKHNLLINEIIRLKREVNNRDNIIQEITTDYNELSDSLIDVIDTQDKNITQREFIIKNLENKLYTLNNRMIEESSEYETIVYTLEDSLSVLNSLIIDMNLTISELSKRSRKN